MEYLGELVVREAYDIKQVDDADIKKTMPHISVRYVYRP